MALYPGTPFARPTPVSEQRGEPDRYGAEAFARFVAANPQVITIGKKGSRKGKPEVRRVPFEQTPQGRPMVTKHIPIWVQADVDALTGSPGTFAKAALAAGREVLARRAGGAVQVAVRHGRAPLVASWVDGRTKGVYSADLGKLSITAATALLFEASE